MASSRVVCAHASRYGRTHHTTTPSCRKIVSGARRVPHHSADSSLDPLRWRGPMRHTAVAKLWPHAQMQHSHARVAFKRAGGRPNRRKASALSTLMSPRTFADDVLNTETVSARSELHALMGGASDETGRGPCEVHSPGTREDETRPRAAARQPQKNRFGPSTAMRYCATTSVLAVGHARALWLCPVSRERQPTRGPSPLKRSPSRSQ